MLRCLGTTDNSILVPTIVSLNFRFGRQNTDIMLADAKASLDEKMISYNVLIGCGIFYHDSGCQIQLFGAKTERMGTFQLSE